MSGSLERTWPAIPLSLFGAFVVLPVSYYMIRRKITHEPPIPRDPTHGDRQFVAWYPICEPIGSCFVALWHFFTCGVTRRPNRRSQDHQHGQVEAVDGSASDGIELQNVNGRPKRNAQEQQAAVNDDTERQSLASHVGQVDVPAPTRKGKSIWNRMIPFGRGNKNIADPQSPERGRPQTPWRHVDFAEASSSERDQQRVVSTLYGIEPVTNEFEVLPEE